MWTALAILYVCTGELGRRVQNRWYLSVPVVLFAAFESVLGLAQHFTGAADQFATGTYAEHSHLAGLLEMALPFAVMFPLERLTSGNRPDLKPAVAMMLSAPAILLFLGLVYSYSRMGLAASILSLALLAVGWRHGLRRRIGFWRVAVPVAAVATFVILFAPVGLIDRFGRISSLQGFAHDAHLARWKATGKLIAARPLFGSGLGTYRTAFQPYNEAEPHRPVIHADNEYLELFAELGAVGFGLAVCFTVAAFRSAISVYRRSDSCASEQAVALASVAALTALLVHSVVEFQLHVPANALVFVWICGMHAGQPAAPSNQVGWSPYPMSPARAAQNETG